MGIIDWFSPVKISKHHSTFKFSGRAKIVTLWLLFAAAAVFLFSFSKLLPVFIWAAVAAYLFNPIITFFSGRTKASRAISIAVFYVLFGLVMFFTVKTAAPLLSNEIAELTSGKYDQASFIGRIASQGNFSVMGMKVNLKETVDAFSAWITDQVPSNALPIFFGAVERLVLMIVFFIIMFYFLLESERYREGFERMIPDPYREEISGLIDRMNLTLGSYIRAQVVLIVIMSAASFTVLYTLKIKYAFVLSIMTGILEVIPIVGPICATAIVTMVALFQNVTPFGISHGLLGILVVLSYFILRQLEDYFIIPNVAAKFVKVHPVVGIFSLLAGGMLGGVLGLFLAIPTAALLKVFLSYVYHKLVE